MQRRVSLAAVSVLLVFVACTEDHLGSSSDGGGGGTSGGAGGAGGGGAGVSTGCGGAGGNGVIICGPVPTPARWEQVTCSVQRTECSGFAEDDSTGLDGLDVSCPTANLVQNVSFSATICYQTGGTGTVETPEQEQADAQTACDKYCADGFLGLYPLGALAKNPNMDGGVTCSSTAQNYTITYEIAGQCSTTKPGQGPDPGATTFANCELFGRACDAQETAKDGTQYCTSMPTVNLGQFTGGCFDSTMTTAEAVCRNGLQFPMLSPGAANKSDQFAYWAVAGVLPEDNEADCQAQLNNIGFATSGIARGPIRAVHN